MLGPLHKVPDGAAEPGAGRKMDRANTAATRKRHFILLELLVLKVLVIRCGFCYCCCWCLLAALFIVAPALSQGSEGGPPSCMQSEHFQEKLPSKLQVADLILRC